MKNWEDLGFDKHIQPEVYENYLKAFNKLEDLYKNWKPREEELTAWLKLVFDESKKSSKKYSKEYPDNAPNAVLNHAILQWIWLWNNQILKKWDFHHLFDIWDEEIYSWTYEDDKSSLIIIKNKLNWNDLSLWKTAASILELAMSLRVGFESIYAFDYDWIYNFKKNVEIDNQHFLNKKYLSAVEYPQSCFKINDFRDVINIINLLHQDDDFYTATQNLISSISHHQFCQICVLSKSKKHKHNEPDIWEKIKTIPNMEIAILQSAKSAELILWKPWRNKERVKERWKAAIGLNPDSIFELENKTFLEYYYSLFELRANSAHSIGSASYELTRKLTISAQTFSWIILIEYYKKNRTKNELVFQQMNWNKELANKFDTNFYTDTTKRD